jgi:Bacterial Ig domain/CHRD domain
MHAPQPNPTRLLILAYSALFAVLAACGGGYGSSGGGGGGGVTCGGAYNVACPPPTVSISAPAANATVSGTVVLTATATAASQYGVTVASVEFLVDNASVGTVMASPYTFMWDSTKVANGDHTLSAMVTDSVGGNATSPGVVVNVQNAGAMGAVLEPMQIFPTPSSKASGTARINVQESGALSGQVTLSGMTARTVTINTGFAGASGDEVLALTAHGGRAGEWDVPEGTQLGSEQLAALMQGRLYVIATSRAYPDGEVRGQLAPESIRVTFSTLSASPAEAARGGSASGMAATTVDTNARTLTVHVDSSGLEAATAAQVSGAGGKLAELARDSVDPGHFSTELARISAADVESFKAGQWSVSVAAAAAPEGAIRGEIRP